MLIPETFLLGPDRWRVKYKKMRKYGETDFYERTITLRRGLSQEQLEQTFGHELVHAIGMQLGRKSLDRSERQTEALGAMLVQFINQV